MINTLEDIPIKQKTLLRMCYNALQDKKAEEVLVLDIREISSVADYFMICHGTSTTQVRAISDNVEKTLRKNGIKNFRIEGKSGGTWILMDLSDIILHIFHQPTRAYYALDKLWSDALQLDKTEIEAWEGN